MLCMRWLIAVKPGWQQRWWAWGQSLGRQSGGSASHTAAVLDLRAAQLGARWLRRHILADVGLVQDVSFQLHQG